MNIFSVIFMNFWGFDIFIFLAAVFNGFVFYMVKLSSDKLKAKMSHTVYVPHFFATRREADEQVALLREEDVLGLRAASDRFYSLFVNLTGIFPLLGILGTVVSLLGLVSDAENITGNFYAALTSTFWGLIFAIIFKFLDGLIAPQIEHNEKSVKLYLDGITNGDTAVPAAVIPEAAAAGTAEASQPETDSEDGGDEE